MAPIEANYTYEQSRTASLKKGSSCAAAEFSARTPCVCIYIYIIYIHISVCVCQIEFDRMPKKQCQLQRQFQRPTNVMI